MVFGFGDVCMAPKTNIMYLWRHQDTANKIEKESRIRLNRYHVWESQVFENPKFEKLWKRCVQGNPEDPTQHFLANYEYGINVSQKTRNGILVI